MAKKAYDPYSDVLWTDMISGVDILIFLFIIDALLTKIGLISEDLYAKIATALFLIGIFGSVLSKFSLRCVVYLGDKVVILVNSKPLEKIYKLLKLLW
jgi:hypothetical protein